jgi:hypothetical protein
MKKHILRAPGTDRYLLSVPESLADLNDYNSSYASGTMYTQAATIVEVFTEKDINANTGAGLSNITVTPLVGIIVNVPGVYLVLGWVSWQWAAPGAPNFNRTVGVSKNGVAAFDSSMTFDHDLTGGQAFDDQFSFLLRLQAGDRLNLRVRNNMSVAAEVTIGSLQLAKVAPLP